LGARYLTDAVSRPDREHDRPCPKGWHAGRDWYWRLKEIAGSTDDVRSGGDTVAKVESCICPNFW